MENTSHTSQIVVGLDIGTTKICAIVGEKNTNGKVNILGVGKVSSLGGVTEGMVSNISKTSEAIKNALQIAAMQSKVKIENVLVGIAGKHIKSFTHTQTIYRFNPDSEITAKELEEKREEMRRMVPETGSKILHVLPQDYIIDGIHTDNPENMTGVKLEINYHIITGQVLAAQNILKCVEKAGLEMEDIVVEPVASAKAVLTDDEMENGVAIVDIGGGTTDIAVFHKGRIRHTAVIPIGGQLITQDVSHAFRVMESQAEKMKVKYGNAIPTLTAQNQLIVVPGINGSTPKHVSVRNLSKVINARLTELFEAVNKEIHRSGYAPNLIAGIVLTGGGAELKNIQNYLEYVTGIDVKIGYPNQHIAKGINNEVTSPLFATGTGLVIYGLEGVETPTNVQNVEPTKKPQEPGHGQKPGLWKNFINFTGSLKGILVDEAEDDAKL